MKTGDHFSFLLEELEDYLWFTQQKQHGKQGKSSRNVGSLSPAPDSSSLDLSLGSQQDCRLSLQPEDNS